MAAATAPDHQGWLKVSPKTPKNFKKLWCALEQGVLKAYTEPGKGQKLTVDIRASTAVEPAPDSKVQPAFKVVEKGGSVYFTGATREEVSVWVHVLDRARQGLSPDPPEEEVVRPPDVIKRPMRPTRRTKPQ